MHHIAYNKYLQQFSRDLRKKSTAAEVFLWQHLKSRKMKGYQFYRQKPLGNYIVDFYCRSLNLVIELDGIYHFQEEQVVKDKVREEILKSMGVNFLRFTEQRVREDLETVLFYIGTYISEYESLHPEVKNFAKRNII